MKCEMCGRDLDGDLDLIVFLPRKQPDAKLKLVTFACEGCSVESGMYCQKHEHPHTRFNDETTACTTCIKDIATKDGERIAGIFAAAVSKSDKAAEIQEAIRNWIGRINLMIPGASLAELPPAVRILGTPYVLNNIVWEVVTYSQRMKIPPEEVIKRVAKEGAGVILPRGSTEKV